ncbi:uncharacterized protein CXQ87_002429 [Candidozyma duobushaemuli]|uniref:Pre-mRNA-splicing factor n=2 Tax=Candidozyma TaxID=3303203 RepID=A0ABX8I2P6_9ASCO|nr:uncharacterized protein CXQ87_002429 [[Candida] duobushaemulonis]PVH14301.1 hypothetical protein CXQ87_002429 [[Candida] duobushaemulonis]QWU87525.1 hypothetical protein CA3LBN_001790 [[Candida] haemuloni]
MAGFSLNLKGKVQKPGKIGGRPLKKTNLETLQKNVLGDNEDKEDTSTTSIDSFSKKGAMAGGSAVNEKKPLVIKPQRLSKGLLRKNERTTDSKPASGDEARQSLLKGESFDDDSSMIITGNEDNHQSSADYESVPVDLFGAALLRGMGWDGSDAHKEDKSLSHRQKGAVLGIGSKPLKEDLEKDIMGDRNTKLSAPLKKREMS